MNIRGNQHGLKARSRIRELGVLTFCILFVGLQIILSLRGLSHPGRVRFAWGMYAVAWSLPTIDIVYGRSVEEDVAYRFITLKSRPEIDYGRLLPPYICAAVPSAQALHVEDRIYRCRR